MTDEAADGTRDGARPTRERVGSEGAGGIRESEQVSSVVHRYFSSFTRGSGTELCPLSTQSAQDKMVDVVESDERELGRSSTVPGTPKP